MRLLLITLFPCLALAQAIQPSGGGGGVTISGSPSANQVTLFATGTSVKGDSNLTWDTTNKTLTIAGTASGANAIELPQNTRIDWGGLNLQYNFLTGQFGMNAPLSVFGDVEITRQGGRFFTAGDTNNVTIVGASTGSPVTITTAGGDTNVGLNLITQGTATVQHNGIIVPVQHSATLQAIEAGKCSLTTGSCSPVFGTDFGSAPDCTCSPDGTAVTSGCAVGTPGTHTLTIKTLSSAANAYWICIGPK